MPKKIKKIEPEETSFLDLVANAGISFEPVGLRLDSKKDVKKTLCKYRGFVRVLKTEEDVNTYIDQCKKNGIFALDTETNNSLDIHDNIMLGLCIYTPFNKPAYIPIMHRDKISGKLAEGQVSKEFMLEKLNELSRLKIVFHNAKFDVNVIRYNYGINLPIFWDTLIAAKLLDENRLSNGLKALYVEGIDPCLVDYHVTTFFEDNTTSNIEDFALYSAIDAYDTFKVYEKQSKELSTPSMSKLRKLLEDLEFRVTEVCADMEWRGFTFNEELCKNYIKTESAKLKALEDKISLLLEPYYEKIVNWQYKEGGRGLVRKIDKETGLPVKKKEKKVIIRGGREIVRWEETDEYEMVKDPYAKTKLEWPVKLTSPDQVLCLLNCILGIEINSTVVDDLKATGNEIAILIGKYRHLNHNLTSFFRPYLELSKNGRMYATFNQMGGAKNGEDGNGEDKTVKTGRFSCIAEGERIECLNGRKPIEEIKVGDYVYCYSPDKKIQLRKVLNVFDNGLRDCVEVKWQSVGCQKTGSLICTPDHRLLTKEGNWIEAGKIKGRIRMAHLRRQGEMDRPRMSGWLGQREEEQRIVKRSIFNKPDDNTWHIHHLDGNPHNNSLDNLVPMKREDHLRRHTLSRIESGNFVPYSPVGKERPDKAKGGKNYVENNGEFITPEEVRAELIRLDFHITKADRDSSLCLLYRRMKAFGMDLSEERDNYYWPREKFEEVFDRCEGIPHRIRKETGLGFGRISKLIERYGLVYNHLVLSVKPAGIHQVYDLEVEEFHNFIAEELVVHNCKDPNLQQLPSRQGEDGVRLLFMAPIVEEEKEFDGDEITLFLEDEVETKQGWVRAKSLTKGDLIISDGEELTVLNITPVDDRHLLVKVEI